jgi:hypothetical protein
MAEGLRVGSTYSLSDSDGGAFLRGWGGKIKRVGGK